MIPPCIPTVFSPGCRDYIHIMDLAVGHVAALKQILNPDFTGIKVSNSLFQISNRKINLSNR